jgi:stage V sporulation protein B
MTGNRRVSYKRGAAVLGTTMVIAKLIGAVYKLPLLNILGTRAQRLSVTYQIYGVLLAASTRVSPYALAPVSAALPKTGRVSPAPVFCRAAGFGAWASY